MNQSRKPKVEHSHIYFLQILFAAGITLGSQSLDLQNKNKWATCIARYVIYILTVQASKAISMQVYHMLLNKQGLDIQLLEKVNKNQVMMYLVSVAIVYFSEQKLFGEDFTLIFIAYLIIKYPEVEAPSNKATVTYGTGMACSYIEGYLVHILPSNGADIKGFQDKILAFEGSQGVVFPVRRMFIIITKSLHCPPDLKEFNDKSDRQDVARLEACQISDDDDLTFPDDTFQSFEDVVKDVAGVKGRNYRNTAYKIIRAGKRPVYIIAELATPMHTLYKVIKNRSLYDELADVNTDVIVSDFISMLETVLPKNPELKNKCELIFFDDTDDSLNLADVLLDRIRELEPNFEEYVNRKN